MRKWVGFLLCIVSLSLVVSCSTVRWQTDPMDYPSQTAMDDSLATAFPLTSQLVGKWAPTESFKVQNFSELRYTNPADVNVMFTIATRGVRDEQLWNTEFLVTALALQKPTFSTVATPFPEHVGNTLGHVHDTQYSIVARIFVGLPSDQ